MSELFKKVCELFGKPELAAETESRQVEERSSTSPPWPCPHCGNPAEIEAVERSLDGTRMLTFWRCEPCQIWAVTPSTQKEPPSAWVSKKEQ